MEFCHLRPKGLKTEAWRANSGGWGSCLRRRYPLPTSKGICRGSTVRKLPEHGPEHRPGCLVHNYFPVFWCLQTACHATLLWLEVPLMAARGLCQPPERPQITSRGVLNCNTGVQPFWPSPTLPRTLGCSNDNILTLVALRFWVSITCNWCELCRADHTMGVICRVDR